MYINASPSCSVSLKKLARNPSLLCASSYAVTDTTLPSGETCCRTGRAPQVIGSFCGCAGRLIRAPDRLLGLQHQTSWWFRNNARRIAGRSPDLSYRLFDRILGVTLSLGAEATESTLGESPLAGRCWSALGGRSTTRSTHP